MKVQEGNSRVSKTVFTCSCCNATLDYVQLIGAKNNIEADFFLCENCGSRIDTLMVEEEEVPAFFD